MNLHYFPSMSERVDEYLARRMQELRGELTQEQWEAATGLPQSTWSKWEDPDGWLRMRNFDRRMREAGLDPMAVVTGPVRHLRAVEPAPTSLSPEVATLAARLDAMDEPTRKMLIGMFKAAMETREALYEDREEPIAVKDSTTP